MSVSGLLNPVVCLVNQNNIEGILYSLAIIHKENFQGKIYFWAHYLNQTEKQKIETFCFEHKMQVVWRESGEEIAYEQFCGEKTYLETELSIALLPWHLQEEQAIIIGPNITNKTWRKILLFQSTKPKHIYKTKTGVLKRFLGHSFLDESCIFMPIKEIKTKLTLEEVLRLIKQL